MKTNFVELRTSEKLEELFRKSNEAPVILFKHSNSCGISSDVFAEISALNKEVNLVVVQQARDISNAIAALTAVKHESPQAIILKNEKAVYSASHYDITAEDILLSLESWREAV